MRIFQRARLQFFVVVVVAIGSAESHSVARAADVGMPVKASPPAVLTWDGCYAGAQLGGAYSRSRWQYDGGNNPFTAADPASPVLITNESFQQAKAAVGGQAGCNFSYSGPWMLGMEAGLIATPMDRSQDQNIAGVGGVRGSIRTEISSIVSATGRIGFSPTQDWLVYAKGGYAGAYIRTSGSLASLPQFDYSDVNWHHGWTVGAGFEYRLFRNVSIGAEYGYYRFGDKDYSQAFVAAPNNPVHLQAGAEVHTAMARMNFYSPDSPAAKTAAAFSSPAFPAGRFSSFVNTSTQVGAWEGTRGPNVFQPDRGRGYQVYSPLAIGVDYDESAFKVETRVKGGYVYTAQRTPGQTAFYSGPVDTQTSFNVVMLNFASIRPQFGVALNLPTGTAYLPNNQRFTRIDPDLAPVGSYGAGFNINPTAGFVVGLDQNTAVSLSGGYAWQGNFVREGINVDIPGPGAFALKQYISPGDIITANFNITTQVGNTTILGTFAYMSESSVTTNGVASGRAGAKYNSNLTLNTKINDKWDIATNFSWSFAEKNDINVGGVLVVEPKNSNSHVVIGSIDPGYLATDRLRVSANYSFLWRDENFYDQIENQFIPAKQKHTVGLGARYIVSDTSSIDVRAGRSWIQQDASSIIPVAPAPSVAAVPPQMNFTAWTVSTGANLRF